MRSWQGHGQDRWHGLVQGIFHTTEHQGQGINWGSWMWEGNHCWGVGWAWACRWWAIVLGITCLSWSLFLSFLFFLSFPYNHYYILFQLLNSSYFKSQVFPFLSSASPPHSTSRAGLHQTRGWRPWFKFTESDFPLKQKTINCFHRKGKERKPILSK